MSSMNTLRKHVLAQRFTRTRDVRARLDISTSKALKDVTKTTLLAGMNGNVVCNSNVRLEIKTDQ